VRWHVSHYGRRPCSARWRVDNSGDPDIIRRVAEPSGARLLLCKGRHDVYAVVKAGGHQYKATVGNVLIVERLPYEVGAQVELDEVYLL